MSLFNINGYSAAEELNKGVFCDAYRVTKGGKDYFMKLYKDPTIMSADYEDFKKNQRIMTPLLNSLGELTETIVDDFENGGRYYQVKEFIAGATDLRKWLSTNDNYAERLDVAIQFCEILKAVHSKKIIHQDLKPEQVMTVVDSSKPAHIRIILTDFDWSVPDGRIVRRVITPGYGNIDTTLSYKSDIFTLGIILCELLSGRSPYALSRSNEERFYDPDSWVNWVENRDYLKPNMINTDIPDAINNIIEQCLDPNPSKRPSLDEILLALKGEVSKPLKAKLRSTTGDVLIMVPNMAYGRRHFKELFGRTTDADSNEIYQYLDRNNATLSLTQKGNQLFLSYPAYGLAKNKILLNDSELTDVPTPFSNGDKISIYSSAKGKVIVSLSLEIV